MSTKNEDSHSNHDDHKEITIVINGTEVVVTKERLTFEEVIALGFDNPPAGDGVQFTVQYSRGNSDKPKGTLIEGQSVQAKERMEFDVTPTNRS